MLTQTDPRPLRGCVVALAASAGGIAALKVVLAALPTNFAAPVLVVLHLDPHRRSRLAQVLAFSSALPVREARAGQHPRAGEVYVAQPATHLALGRGGALALTHAPPEEHVRPSADVLFASVAECCGPDAVAVVLSGLGRDGARGAREVHRRGGTVLAQDPESAEYGAMPQAAVDTGCVDQVVPLERIAGLLAQLIHPSTQA